MENEKISPETMLIIPDEQGTQEVRIRMDFETYFVYIS